MSWMVSKIRPDPSSSSFEFIVVQNFFDRLILLPQHQRVLMRTSPSQCIQIYVGDNRETLFLEQDMTIDKDSSFFYKIQRVDNMPTKKTFASEFLGNNSLQLCLTL